jgi:hypothetical protein
MGEERKYTQRKHDSGWGKYVFGGVPILITVLSLAAVGLMSYATLSGEVKSQDQDLRDLKAAQGSLEPRVRHLEQVQGVISTKLQAIQDAQKVQNARAGDDRRGILEALHDLSRRMAGGTR